MGAIHEDQEQLAADGGGNRSRVTSLASAGTAGGSTGYGSRIVANQWPLNLGGEDAWQGACRSESDDSAGISGQESGSELGAVSDGTDGWHSRGGSSSDSEGGGRAPGNVGTLGSPRGGLGGAHPNRAAEGSRLWRSRVTSATDRSPAGSPPPSPMGREVDVGGDEVPLDAA